MIENENIIQSEFNFQQPNGLVWFGNRKYKIIKQYRDSYRGVFIYLDYKT